MHCFFFIIKNLKSRKILNKILVKVASFSNICFLMKKIICLTPWQISFLPEFDQMCIRNYWSAPLVRKRLSISDNNNKNSNNNISRRLRWFSFSQWHYVPLMWNQMTKNDLFLFGVLYVYMYDIFHRCL